MARNKTWNNILIQRVIFI